MRKDIEKIVDASKRALKRKDDEIVLLREKITKMSGEKAVIFKMPDLNIPDTQKSVVTNFPEEQKVKISNFPDRQSVHVVNLKDIREVKFPEVQKVEVTNHKEDGLKAEGWLPGVMARIGIRQAEYIIKALTSILEGGVSVRLSKNQFTEPVPVIVTDGEGKVLKSLGHTPMISMGGGQSSGHYIPTRVNVGKQTVPTPGTPVALASVPTPCSAVIITAYGANMGMVAIGGTGVSITGSLGAVLSPLGSFKIDINDVSKVYVDAEVADDGVNFTYVS